MMQENSVRRAVQVLTLLGLSMSLPACATITRGTSQQFTIDSRPPGALATTSNGFRCEATPCIIRMPRKDGFFVTISKEGYVTQTQSVQSGMSGAGGTALAGNLLVGGIIGVGVDATSGALNDLTPNPLIVDLEPVAAAPVARSGTSETAQNTSGPD